MELLSVLIIFLLAMLGVPLFVIMSLLALSLFSLADINTSAIAIEIYKIASAPTLLTIPLFTFAGYLLAESKSPQRLFNLATASLGFLPGGVAIVSLIICAFFTAFTGASGVTIIALGGLLYPVLQKEGYSDDFSLGLLTTSGSLGLLFPPSLPIILYGIVAKVDIDQLFVAGLVPGILLIVVLSIYSIVMGPKRSSTQSIAFSFPKLIKTAKEAFFELLIPIMVLGGIYGGWVTASEAAALTAFYVLIVVCFIHKDLCLFKDVPAIIKESQILVGAILLILCCALGVTNYLVDEQVPVKIVEFMSSIIESKYTFLICLNIFLLVVGAMMDIFSAIIVVVPLIVPVAAQYDVHPIHLAIIFLTNLEIGYITPPVGINLFISSFRFNKPVTHLYKVSIPYLILLMICLLIITYVPALSLFGVNV